MAKTTASFQYLPRKAIFIKTTLVGRDSLKNLKIFDFQRKIENSLI